MVDKIKIKTKRTNSFFSTNFHFSEFQDLRRKCKENGITTVKWDDRYPKGSRIKNKSELQKELDECLG